MSDGTCFLCSPDPALVFTRSDDFFAMLGYGPLGEGYSLLATVEHTRSMLDVDPSLLPQLSDFTESVRDLLGQHYGPLERSPGLVGEGHLAEAPALGTLAGKCCLDKQRGKGRLPTRSGRS